jgi:putative transcriptional regulator
MIQFLQTGDLLVAKPFMDDPYFKRAVVLLCEHTDKGSMGFVLNKPIDMKINDIISDFPPIEAGLFYGGPVQTDTLHYLHRAGNLLEDSVSVGHGVYWGGDFDNLRFLIESRLLLAEDIRFFVGYAGWDPGQIQEEIEMDSWFTAPFDANYVFKSPPEALWSLVMRHKGDAFEVLSHLPDNITWN